MDSKLREFLVNRNIPDAVINLLEYEKIDVSIIPNMEVEALQSYFPKHGDRIAIVQFCRDINNSSKIKGNLLEKLRNKMKRKPKNTKHDDDSSSLSSSENLELQKKVKLTRQIEIGLIHDGKQVRAKCGGGTRKVNLPKKSTKSDIIKSACELFFPNGISKKGHLSDMELDLTDFSFNVIDPKTSLEELFQQTKLFRIRCYLKTEKKLNNDEALPAIGQQNEITSTSTVVYNNPLNEMIENIFGDTSSDTNDIQIEFLEDGPDNFNNEREHISNATDELFPVLEPNEQATLILHRGNIYEDMIEAFKQSFFDFGQIRIEMILPNGEKEFAEDFGGVLRDAFSEFWQSFYEKHTLGTNFKVPYIRHDVCDKQLEALAKVILRGFQCERYIPIRLAPVFLKTCLGYSFTNEELIDSFMKYISDSEAKLVKNALKNFEGVDFEELLEFFTPFDTKRLPNENNITQLITEIAYQELVRKPGHFIRCFENVLKILKVTITESSLEDAYNTITPTSKNCLSKIKLQKEDCTTNETTVFNYLKKFIKESDDKIRAAFLRFTTGCDLAINNISVSFTDSSGYSRTPVAHTCTGLLELPSSYENFVSFRSEMNSLLTSNIWIMDII